MAENPVTTKNSLGVFLLLLFAGVGWLLFHKMIPSIGPATNDLSGAGAALNDQTPPVAYPQDVTPGNVSFNFGAGIPSSDIDVPSILPVHIPTSPDGERVSSSSNNGGGGCSGNCDGCGNSKKQFVPAAVFIRNIPAPYLANQQANLESLPANQARSKSMSVSTVTATPQPLSAMDLFHSINGY